MKCRKSEVFNVKEFDIRYATKYEHVAKGDSKYHFTSENTQWCLDDGYLMVYDNNGHIIDILPPELFHINYDVINIEPFE